MPRPPWVRRRDRRYGRRQREIRRREQQYTEWELEGRQSLEQLGEHNDQAAA